MMRRAAAFFLALFACMTVYAQVYSSNVLMQKLSVLDEVPQEGWYIVSGNGIETLFNGDEKVKSVTRTPDSIVTEEGGLRSEKHFSDGRLDYEILSDGTRADYEYSENGILKQIIYSREGEPVRQTEYRFTSSGTLAAVIDKENGQANFYDDGRITYREGDTVQIRDKILNAVTDSRNEEAEREDKADGYVLISRDEAGRILADGYVLISRDEAGRIFKEEHYTFDDEIVESVMYTYTQAGELSGRTVTQYDESGKWKTEHEYSSGQLVSISVRLSDGNVECTRYRNGSEYARIIYDRECTRVLSLEML